MQICDSRSGSPIFHKLTFPERAVLDAFEKPTAVLAVKKRAVVDESGLLPAIQSLRRKGLLFLEGNRGISLVLRHPTPVCPTASRRRSGPALRSPP